MYSSYQFCCSREHQYSRSFLNWPALLHLPETGTSWEAWRGAYKCSWMCGCSGVHVCVCACVSTERLEVDTKTTSWQLVHLDFWSGVCLNRSSEMGYTGRPASPEVFLPLSIPPSSMALWVCINVLDFSYGCHESELRPQIISPSPKRTKLKKKKKEENVKSKNLRLDVDW